jgi:hypothetical protein
MNTQLNRIQQKIDNLQQGLLRIRDKQGHLTLHVKATAHDDASLNCIVIEDTPGQKLINRKVNLIQKNYNDYLYITGKVKAEVHKGCRILSIQILKACWFVRMSNGNTSWLREKYIFETPLPEMEKAS